MLAPAAARPAYAVCLKCAIRKRRPITHNVWSALRMRSRPVERLSDWTLAICGSKCGWFSRNCPFFDTCMGGSWSAEWVLYNCPVGCLAFRLAPQAMVCTTDQCFLMAGKFNMSVERKITDSSYRLHNWQKLISCSKVTVAFCRERLNLNHKAGHWQLECVGKIRQARGFSPLIATS